MKKSLLIFTGFLLSTLSLIANYYSNLPYTITQPNGDEIKCFVSGDEFFNWIHDQEGFTIIQASDGYFYYGEESGNVVVPTKYKVNSVNPADIGLTRWAKISASEYQKAKAVYDEPVDLLSNSPHEGTLNNLVVYIRFSDDTEFTETRQTFDNKFNPTPGTSLKSYFDDASYGQFTVNSTHYPACAMTTNLSYQDTHPRSYFQPYNATTNTNGYSGGDNGSERTQREHTLLSDAINWINTNSPVAGTINIDGDNDGYVDNVCFNVRGNSGAWAVLLWAHSWSLYSYNVSINGKRVYKYTFQPENQVSVQTLCHEMFHSVGAPDLYHYTGNGINPVSSWDLMESGFGHMGAYMKWKYTNHTWISSIPEITTSGTYTLNPLASATNNCYKIASPNSTSQFFIVEYRKKVTGSFENNLSGSGLLVYRIDPTRTGNANGPPDEVYIYRPNGTTTANGTPSNAIFSSESGRTAINQTTNPSPFLQNGSPGGLEISNVTSAGNSISFTVSLSNVENPSNLTATPFSSSQIDLQWQNNSSNNEILLACSDMPIFGTPITGISYFEGDTIPGGGTIICSGSFNYFNHINLNPISTYYYKLWSYDSDNKYSTGITQNATTLCNIISSFPWNEGFEYGERFPDCWGQEQINNSEVFWGIVPGNGNYNPASAHSGIFNACLKDFTSTDNKSRLITPAINLGTLGNPMLTFWHTQEIWGSDQDNLTVYYKTSYEGTWTQLATYSTDISVWTQETIILPNASTDYYICFEGNARYGYGICIDDIEISGTTVPANLNLTGQTIGDGKSECFDATDTIIVSGSENTVEFLTGSAVDLIAGNTIIFLPGFRAYEGCVMNAFITTEELFCNIQPMKSLVEKNSVKNAQLLNSADQKKWAEKDDLNVKIYPNPNNGLCTLELANFEQPSLVRVFNIVGTVVFQTTLHNANFTELDLTYLLKGLYFINVENGQNSKTIKIIVK